MSATKKQPQKPKLAKKPAKKQDKSKTREAPAARMTSPARTGIGLPDVRDIEVSWVCGYSYVGDGVLGFANSVYFQPIGSLSAVVDSSVGVGDSGQVAILSADSTVGATYLADIEKHFSRKVIKSLSLELIPLNPSTANSAVVYVAPFRGASASGNTITATGATPPFFSLANLLSASGSRSCASYERCKIDMTSYIAGGAGPKQNDFNISGDFTYAWGSAQIDLNGIAPAAFSLGGLCSTAALQGKQLHLVIVRQKIDLLDYIGGLALVQPFAFKLSKEDLREVTKAMIAANKGKASDLLENDLFRRLSKCVPLSG